MKIAVCIKRAPDSETRFKIAASGTGIDEAGVKGFEAIAMFGLYGPKNIPADLVQKINQDVNTALASPDLKEKLSALGATPGQMTQAEFDKYVNKEIDKWAEVIEAADIKLPK